MRAIRVKIIKVTHCCFRESVCTNTLILIDCYRDLSSFFVLEVLEDVLAVYPRGNLYP